MSFIEPLISQGYLKTPHIIDAFRAVKREDFLPEELKYQADMNIPLPIGWGQTISQPLTVAIMLELLRPEEGNRILDIGAGSGWISVLLGYIVSGGQKRKDEGKVYAVEIVPQLCEFGRENISKYNFIKRGVVEHLCGSATRGFPQFAPFDRIYAAAAGDEVPQAWKDQLAVGGRMVIPLKSSIWLFTKKSKTEFIEQEFPGFAFVPLV